MGGIGAGDYSPRPPFLVPTPMKTGNGRYRTRNVNYVIHMRQSIQFHSVILPFPFRLFCFILLSSGLPFFHNSVFNNIIIPLRGLIRPTVYTESSYTVLLYSSTGWYLVKLLTEAQFYALDLLILAKYYIIASPSHSNHTMSELNSSFESLRSLRWDVERRCCASGHRVKWLKNKGAILIVVWSYLVGSALHLLRDGYKDKTKEYVSNTGIILVCSTLLYPIGGWLADTRLGRYTVIRYSMWIMWIVSLLLTFNEVLACVISGYDNTAAKWPVFAALSLVMAIAFGGFLSNIVQLGIDQLTDASAMEITSFITWYTMTAFTSGVIFHYVSDCIQEKYQILYVKPFFVSVCLSVALCSDYLFQHWLIKEHVAGRSLQAIFSIIKYTIRNRKFKYNYSNEYESLSSFDIAKHRYGGPFTSQQVENVRTFLWMILVLAVFALICGIPIPLDYAQDKMMRPVIDSLECYTKTAMGNFGSISITIFILFFEFILLPLLSNFLPRVSIMGMFTLGAIATSLWIISLLIIDVVAHEDNLYSGKCIFTEASNHPFSIDYKWFLIPKSLQGLVSALLILSFLKFVWSQSPVTMKGMVLGFGYFFLGVSSLIHTAIASPFIFRKPVTVSWVHVKLTCGIWYLLMEGVISVIVTIIVFIVIRQYRKRNSCNEFYNSYTISVNN